VAEENLTKVQGEQIKVKTIAEISAWFQDLLLGQSNILA
jgi:hypothetical protein